MTTFSTDNQTNDILLKANGLCYTYEGDNKPALNNLSLEIKRGKKIACMGSNGSGKSTFFLCCNGILKPDSGKLFYQGETFCYSKKWLLELRKKVGIIFQNPDRQLFCASVRQEISFGLLNLGYSEKEARKKVDDIMEELHITPFAHKPTHSLSGGQKKLVSIADILVMEPELMILDEPAAALDPLHVELIHKIIEHITSQGITVMMATHDVNYAFEWADEILLFHEGTIIKHGKPEEVFSDSALMEQTCLRPPMILTMYHNLIKSGILNADIPVPKTLEELQCYIEKSYRFY